MSCLRTTFRPLRYLRCQGQWTPFLYCGRSGALLGCYRARLFRQDRAFFLPRPANDRFHIAVVQRDPAIPSSILPAFPVPSPCLDANKEIDLRVTGSLGCWSLQLYQTNQMWGGEPSELLMTKGYWIVVGAKPLHVIDETFCSIPTDGTNSRYLDRLTSGALAERYKPAKNGVQRWCASRLSDD